MCTEVSRKFVREDGKTTTFQYFGGILIVVSILILMIVAIIESRATTSDNLSKASYGNLVAVCFLLVMLGISFLFPSMLKDENDGLSTMRVVVFMLVCVFVGLVIKNSWDDPHYDISEHWMFIILSALGGKSVQAYAEVLKQKYMRNPLPVLPGNVGGAQQGGDPGIQPGNAVFVNNGAVWANTQICLVFAGKAWKTPELTQLRGDTIAAMNNIVSSTYFNGLQEYGVQSVQLSGSPVISPNGLEIANGFFSSNVAKALSGCISSGALPQPTNQMLYLLILPTGIQNSDNSLTGLHSMTPFNNENIFFAWVTCDGNLNDLTVSISHELVELISNPGGNRSGVVGSGGGCVQAGDPCEICDICSSTFQLGNVMVNQYYSQNKSTCIGS